MTQQANHDYDEESVLKAFAKETVEIANEYADARYAFAEAKLKMDSRLADAYKNGTVKDSMAIDKAYIQLTVNEPEAKSEYEAMIKEEQAYKGLDQVLEARKNYVSLHQSLIKNKPQATTTA